jgi:hypothetical protein
MIIAVPKIIPGRLVKEGDQVILINECTSILDHRYSIAVYDITGTKIGYCAKKFASTGLQVNLLLRGMKSYVWLVDKNFLLVKVVDCRGLTRGSAHFLN